MTTRRWMTGNGDRENGYRRTTAVVPGKSPLIGAAAIPSRAGVKTTEFSLAVNSSTPAANDGTDIVIYIINT